MSPLTEFVSYLLTGAQCDYPRPSKLMITVAAGGVVVTRKCVDESKATVIQIRDYISYWLMPCRWTTGTKLPLTTYIHFIPNLLVRIRAALAKCKKGAGGGGGGGFLLSNVRSRDKQGQHYCDNPSSSSPSLPPLPTLFHPVHSLQVQVECTPSQAYSRSLQ